MKIEKFIHPYFNSLSPFISDLAGSFYCNGNLMHTGRNEVRVVEVEGYKVVIKSFVRITWINRIIYSLFRKSKAQRAYENAEILLANDIVTPVPVAYINSYRFGLLQKSFFISLYVNYGPVKELFSQPVSECKDALIQFTRFTHKLHQLGIFHGDYTQNNVLYYRVSDKYIFSLIDNNRIRFRKPTKRRTMQNLQRLNLQLDAYATLAMEYARLEDSDSFETAHIMLFYLQARKVFLRFKRSVKKGLKMILENQLKGATAIR